MMEILGIALAMSKKILALAWYNPNNWRPSDAERQIARRQIARRRMGFDEVKRRVR